MSRMFIKKTCGLALICATAMLFSSCGGYLRHQDYNSMNRPCDCTGYHMNHAVWHYTDRFGQTVDVVGKCTRGMKNGNFDFFVDGIQVARTKFSRDEEIKTKCLISGGQVYNLYTCMNLSAQQKASMNGGNNNANVMPVQAPAPVPVKKSVWD